MSQKVPKSTNRNLEASGWHWLLEMAKMDVWIVLHISHKQGKNTDIFIIFCCVLFASYVKKQKKKTWNLLPDVQKEWDAKLIYNIAFITRKNEMQE